MKKSKFNEEQIVRILPGGCRGGEVLSQSGTQSRFIKPGSPWQNAYAERLQLDASKRLSRRRGALQPLRRAAQAEALQALLQRGKASIVARQPPTRGGHVIISKQGLLLTCLQQWGQTTSPNNPC